MNCLTSHISGPYAHDLLPESSHGASAAGCRYARGEAWGGSSGRRLVGIWLPAAVMLRGSNPRSRVPSWRLVICHRPRPASVGFSNAREPLCPGRRLKRALSFLSPSSYTRTSCLPARVASLRSQACVQHGSQRGVELACGRWQGLPPLVRSHPTPFYGLHSVPLFAVQPPPPPRKFSRSASSSIVYAWLRLFCEAAARIVRMYGGEAGAQPRKKGKCRFCQ